MLISEMVDFAGSTEDVTDDAEGMRSGELKHYHCRIAHSHASSQQAVWHNGGCNSAERFVGN